MRSLLAGIPAECVDLASRDMMRLRFEPAREFAQACVSMCRYPHAPHMLCLKLSKDKAFLDTDSRT